MISKTGADLRLRKDRQIRFVLENGFLFRGKHIILRALPANKINPPLEGPGPFLAIVISRKKEKKAVWRNWMKRRLREIFRLQRTEIPHGKAYVAVARAIDKKATYLDLEQDFMNLIAKSKETK